MHGLELAAAAVVATAVIAMARTLARGPGRALLAVAAAALALLVPGTAGQVGTILGAARSAPSRSVARCGRCR